MGIIQNICKSLTGHDKTVCVYKKDMRSYNGILRDCGMIYEYRCQYCNTLLERDVPSDAIRL